MGSRQDEAVMQSIPFLTIIAKERRLSVCLCFAWEQEDEL